ncbi:MAG: putative DNA-binding protein (MmcQ/YjbR family) [Devosia sp.]
MANRLCTMTITDSALMDRTGFEAFVLSLPGVTLVHQWGNASVAKVGDKIFALLSGWATDGDLGLSFKCSLMSYDLLPELEQVRPAPYLARAKWVQVLPGAPLSSDELQAYVREAHRLVAAKLTRKRQAELGLEALIAAGPQKS